MFLLPFSDKDMGKNSLLLQQNEKPIQNITVKFDRSRDHSSAKWLPTKRKTFPKKIAKTTEHQKIKTEYPVAKSGLTFDQTPQLFIFSTLLGRYHRLDWSLPIKFYSVNSVT